MSAILGIDPGKDGALVVLDADGAVVFQERTGDLLVKQEKGAALYSPERMLGALMGVRALGCRRSVLERAQPRPKEGGMSSYVSGEGRGLWRGLLAALGFEVLEPHPVTWTKAMLKDLPGEGWTRAVLLAEAAVGLELRRGQERNPHPGLVDAYCLARYGQRERR